MTAPAILRPADDLLLDVDEATALSLRVAAVLGYTDVQECGIPRAGTGYSAISPTVGRRVLVPDYAGELGPAMHALHAFVAANAGAIPGANVLSCPAAVVLTARGHFLVTVGLCPAQTAETVATLPAAICRAILAAAPSTPFNPEPR